MLYKSSGAFKGARLCRVSLQWSRNKGKVEWLSSRSLTSFKHRYTRLDLSNPNVLDFVEYTSWMLYGIQSRVRLNRPLPILQSTFQQQQQQQRNRAKLHKHTICISLYLNQTKDDRHVTENSFRIDYHHISLSQEMHYFRIREICPKSQRLAR